MKLKLYILMRLLCVFTHTYMSNCRFYITYWL